MQKMKFLAIVGLCGLLCFCMFAATSRQGTAAGEVWGAPVQGLQMSISATRRKAGEPEFQVAFRNTGKKPLTLNLGMMVGASWRPENFRLSLSDDEGKTRELHAVSGGIRGYAADYIVPMRAGSVYRLKLKLNQFWSPDTNEKNLNLDSGKYRVSARFKGSGARFNKPGTKSIKFWKGTLRSNTATIEK